jgi:sugar diacid utilization regulator
MSGMNRGAGTNRGPAPPPADDASFPTAPQPAHTSPDCASLHKLTLLSTLMTGLDESGILQLARSAVPELARCSDPRFYLGGHTWWPADETLDNALITEIIRCGTSGLCRSNGDRSYALPIRASHVNIGYLVFELRPPHDDAAELSPVHVFCQQLAVAIDNARRHARERQLASDLQRVVDEVGTLLAMQEQLNLVAAKHCDVAAVVQVVSELTGLPTAVEDQAGNLLADAGGWQPDLRRRSPSARSRLVTRLRTGLGAERDGDQIVALAEGQAGTHVFLVMSDLDRKATEIHCRVAEFACTVLSLVLAKSAIVAEAELRLRRDLIEELLLGLSQPIAETRAEALGIDLARPRRVAVIEPIAPGKLSSMDDKLLHLVQRELTAQGDHGLAVRRGTGVVCLANDDVDWELIVCPINPRLCSSTYRVGVGSICTGAADYPTSLRHAQQSLRFSRKSESRGVVRFDDLGVYRLLALNADTNDLDGFIDQWLGPLIDYDAARSAQLVSTLTSYLRSGGSLNATASELFIHRSTVKYRLERIRAISKHDLADPETQFSLQLATYALEIRRNLQNTPTAPRPVVLVSSRNALWDSHQRGNQPGSRWSPEATRALARPSRHASCPTRCR